MEKTPKHIEDIWMALEDVAKHLGHINLNSKSSDEILKSSKKIEQKMNQIQVFLKENYPLPDVYQKINAIQRKILEDNDKIH